ncbi:transcription factor GTE8-like isoform X2 [Trifolium pratense]|uniref:transcription factor GTE8-like isoform X2 n=1 Tax=Trifolium pratense TaxID=57577 RepID=UPI001E69315C|nr:transcription factor GTE8-like isoform X2 [Trifolium pratense]
MAKSRVAGSYFGNPLDTVGESEGSGTSGQIDTEITVSEDSSAPARKSISLNSGRRGAFGASILVVPLSKLSTIGRKDLAQRLRSELEHVRQLQKRIEIQRLNGVTLSSSSDILSCNNNNNGNNGQRVEHSRKKSVSSSLPGNKSKFLGKNNKPRGWNRGTSGKFEAPAQGSSPNSTNSLLIKDCESLLTRLMSHQYGWVFNTPVDVVKLNLPDYFTIIKHPMDLGTIKTKIDTGAYSNPLEFAADVRLTFSNAMTYNPPGNDVYIMADTLRKYFEGRWKTIEKKLPRSDALPLPTKPGPRQNVKTTRPTPPSKKRKIVSLPPQPEVITPAKPVMSDEEKHNLGRQLESLLGEIPVHIIDFLKAHSSNGRESGEDEIEIDIDVLSDDTLLTLRKLLDDFLQDKQKNKENVEMCEIEVLNDSGPSNSSLQPFKGNDLADEDVDIGGNEPPVSSYPHAKFEKDVGGNESHVLSSPNAKVENDTSVIEPPVSSDPKDIGGNEPHVLSSPNAKVENDTSVIEPPASSDPDVKVEKDVDGSEPPVLNHPDAEVEKDATCRENKCQSPDHSNDSDSSSSSDSESDDVKASPAKEAKVPEITGSDAQLDEKIGAADNLERNQCVSGLDQVEDSQDKRSSFDSDCQQDGDSGPTERQVSPDKLYRVAILKKRFLDTILKAREKTLTQGEKGDPETLRLEREKLEIEQRKEKARLQAEAKAAEDARKQAEEEAAAEVRRKIELEREAARHALTQMEKTVEINENSRFLDDLERLRAVPAETLPISVDETSPDHAEDGLGSFKFGSSNPLEQLGLYMKVDDEEEEAEPPAVPNPVKDVEEEEAKPPSVPNPVKDVEEGEIDGLGSFKFGSSNPLEQLGLYMKVDDEEEEAAPPSVPNPVKDVEEEEAKPPSVPNPVKDVEEGEIDGLGSFKFGSSNPLEQLGLYMKVDDEEEEAVPPSVLNPVKDVEEEEAKPPSVPNPVKDVEDGEIDGLGSFKFGSSNPLEQLELYMKVDDEEEEAAPPSVPNPVKDVEEEEAKPPSVPYPVKDVEDGEIDGLGSFKFGSSNPLEQLELYMKVDDEEEEAAPPSVPNPVKDVVEEEAKPPSVPNPVKDVEDGEIDGLGSFKFGSSNPLEQLGLYMKVDDEEEEAEPPSVPNPVKDVEKGEID